MQAFGRNQVSLQVSGFGFQVSARPLAAEGGRFDRKRKL
jgi:hypothetical protein